MKRLTAILVALVVLAAVLIGGSKSVVAGVAKEQAQLWGLYNKALAKGDPELFRQIIRKVGNIMREYPSKVNLADMLFLLGLSYENTYRFRKALVYYKELKDVHPYHKNAKAVRYKIDLIEKTYKKEKKALTMFIQQERLMLSKKYDPALDKCRELLSAYPSSSLSDNTQNIIGYIYLTYLKDYAKAKKAYQKLLALYPKSPFHDNAIFAIGRCEEKLGLYQSALRRYKGLKKKHQGFLFSKLDYWSRVWHTRAEEQIRKVEFKLNSLGHKSYPVDFFTRANYDLCMNNKRGSGEAGMRSIKSWVKPEQVVRLAKEKLQLPAAKGFGDNTFKVALRVWNYVAKNYPYAVTVGGEEFWQEPEETIQRLGGDGADSSFFLASLLISGGIEEGKVWVMIGKEKGGDLHYWVNLHHKGEWYVLEPSWKPPFDELPLARHEGYTPYYAFNSKTIKVNPRVRRFIPKCE